MKYILKLLPLLFLAICLSDISGQCMKVMTFNLRYDNPDDNQNNWEYRKESVVALIRHYSPDILSVQEGLKNQLQYLHDSLQGYSYVGVGRDDGKDKGEFCAIFYDTTKYRMISNSTFWLSETPEKVSKGWDAALERICSFAFFQDRESGFKFWIFNTHFDHIGEKARVESARLILRKIKETNIAQFPVVLTGDFNTEKGSEALSVLENGLSEASTVSKEPLYGPKGTFNDFVPNNNTKECIDFIFVSGFAVKSITHIDDRRNNNLCISDHFPVLSEIVSVTK